MNLSTASQSAFANTEDEESQKPLKKVRFDELMQKVEILSQKVQLNEKEKIADVEEQAPLLDQRVDDLMTKNEEVPRKIHDYGKEKCGDEENQKSCFDPRINDALKNIEDVFKRELKEKVQFTKLNYGFPKPLYCSIDLDNTFNPSVHHVFIHAIGQWLAQKVDNHITVAWLALIFRIETTHFMLHFSIIENDCFPR